MKWHSIVFGMVMTQALVWGLISSSQAAEEPVNLAQGKTATASGVQEEYAAALAVDGNVETRWSSEFIDEQWLQVDLGSAQKIGKVVLVWETACAAEYKLQVSDDGKTWKDVASVTEGKAGEDVREFTPVKARFVRMLGSKRGTEWGYSIWEFKVYGVK